MTTLDIVIATHTPEGLNRTKSVLLPPTEGVRYIISWQKHGGAPVPAEIAGRSDVEVHRLEVAGLSLNRNNALDFCRADIILIADDDVTLLPDGIAQLRDYMAAHPEVDLLTLRSLHGDMSRFPVAETPLNHGYPKGYYLTSFELAMRRATAGKLRFCPGFGLGRSRFSAGEEELLLLTAIHHNLNCRFAPITICSHPHASTGLKETLSPSALRAAGCVSALTYPYSAVLRIPLKAWRIWRARQASLPAALRYLASGALSARSVLRMYYDYLWKPKI